MNTSNAGNWSEAALFIGGDVLPLNRDIEAFIEGNRTILFGPILEIMQACDLRVINLEGPLVDRASPISKCGPNLMAPTGSVAGLDGIELVGLANNHIRDHGVEGLNSTCNVLRKAGIEYFGVGETVESALRPIIKNLGGVRVAIMAMGSREFSTVQPGVAGGAPADPIEFRRVMKASSADWDHLVILLHSGRQFYPYPNPELYRFCHFLVEEGASAVICQHSHCLSCEEWYQGKYILYGQGDFVFDYGTPERDYLPGASVILKFDLGGNIERELLFHRHCSDGPGLEALLDRDISDLKKAFNKRSEAIFESNFIAANWKEYSRVVGDKILRQLALPSGKLWRLLDRCLGLSKLLMSQKQRTLWLNYIGCEELRDLLIVTLEREERLM